MTDDLRVLAVRVRGLVGHSPFDHDFVRDERECPVCKTLAEFDTWMETDGGWSLADARALRRSHE